LIIIFNANQQNFINTESLEIVILKISHDKLRQFCRFT